MKLNYEKEWFESRIEKEGSMEIGAGLPPGGRAPVSTTPPEEGVLDTRIGFGRFVELWRRNKGWTAEKLAAAAGIDREEVLQIEYDVSCEAEPEAVLKLAEVFGVPSRALLDLAGLTEYRASILREKATRFASQSESTSALSDREREMLEAFLAALSKVHE